MDVDDEWQGECADCGLTFPVRLLEQLPAPDGLIQVCRECFKRRNAMPFPKR